MSLLYYEQEHARWPRLYRRTGGRGVNPRTGRKAPTLTPEEARLAIEKFSRYANITPPVVEFTSGRNSSHANRFRIVLNVEALDWLLVAHEFAHSWDHVRRPISSRWHDKKHARLVDRLCLYLLKREWHTGRLAHGLALKEETARRREARAACPPPPEDRIARREAQVKRLRTKIKALTTRLKTAERSLNALRRRNR